MIGRIDLDEKEFKKYTGAYKRGKRFRSFRLGVQAGKTDGAKIEDTTTSKNPFPIPSELYELLQKRARWQAGYDLGWEIGREKKRKKLKRRG